MMIYGTTSVALSAQGALENTARLRHGSGPSLTVHARPRFRLVGHIRFLVIPGQEDILVGFL